jgi:hypothetical protein
MSVVDKLVIQVSFDNDGFSQSAKKVNEEIKKVSKTTETELGKGLDKKKFEEKSKVIVNVMEQTTKSISGILTKGLAGIGTVIGAKFAIDFVQAFGEKSKNLELGASTLNYNRQGGQLFEKLFGRVGNSQNAGGALANLSKSINSFTGNSNLAKFLGQIGKTIYDESGNKKTTDVLLTDVIEGLRDYGSVAGKDKQLAAFNEVGLFPPEVLKLAQLDKNKYQDIVKNIIPTLTNDKTLQKGVDTAEKWAALNDRIAQLQADVGSELYDTAEKLVNVFEYIGNVFGPAAKAIGDITDIFGAHVGAGSYRTPVVKYNAADLNDPRKKAIIENQKKESQKINDYFINLYKSSGQSLRSLGSHIADTSIFNKTNKFTSKVQLSTQNPNSFNNLLGIIAQKETNNGKNINDATFKEGSKFRGYGKYQVTPEAFKDVHGRNITNIDKSNQSLLDETAQKYFDLGIQKYGAKTIQEQLAFWNGGPEGIDIARNNFNKSKYGTAKRQKIDNLQHYVNRYSDTGVLNNTLPNIPSENIPSSQLNSQATINNSRSDTNNSKTITNNFSGDIKLPGVKNTTDFAKQFGSIGNNDGTAYGFSRGYT